MTASRATCILDLHAVAPYLADVRDLQITGVLCRSLTSTGASTSLPQGSDAEAGLIKRQTASLSREEQVLVRALHHFRVRRPAKLCWLTLFLLAQGEPVVWAAL